MADNIKSLIEPLRTALSYGDVMAAEQLAKISVAIFKARTNRGMTQKEFADFLGVSQSMVSKWESQDYNYSIGALAEICDKLEMDLNVEIKAKYDAGS